ncbi:FAD-dependent oxidoreductase [Salininema proteolyticum]|uniref:FAD-dependent oxidoreductase n=1 Tax=Salininema proteolyticum TaxID=1607685 RepID=A0ABV8U5X4_9ACTN
MRLAVIGNGMAGSRLARRTAEAGMAVTVFAAEASAAYNRVLLSEYVGGTGTRESITLPSLPGSVDLRTSTEAAVLDAESLTVDGEEFDAVVLATGARPVLPPIPGLDREAERVFTLRDIEDAEAIKTAASRSGRAVVLGGGLLGLEAARGLAASGLAVTVVHAAPHLLERQVDPDGGEMVRRAYAELGVESVCDAMTARVEASSDGVALHLADGRAVEGDFLVVSCGVAPNTGLAADAGLEVGRGVVIDDHCRTSAEGVFAIGDCAEHEGIAYGLVEPAWEQADVVAAYLMSDPDEPRFTGSDPILRLKAKGIELAAMGTVRADEAVSFADPANNTYARLAVADGRLAGAVLVGDNPSVGEIVELYDTGAPLPANRRSLLLGRFETPRAAESSDESLVCRCNNVTLGDLKSAHGEGCRTVEDLAAATAATTGCGTCRADVAAFCRTAAEPAKA